MTAGGPEIVLLGGVRTPFGEINGTLASLTAVELQQVDVVIMGQVVQAAAGQGPARQVAIGGGLGWDVHAQTTNKVCLSGLCAIIDVAD